MTARPYRSVLYIPASKERALEKAHGLACDAIIFDLEDAVAPSEKEAARSTLAAALTAGAYAPRARLVRINALDTAWGEADAKAANEMDCDGVLLPKVDGPEHLDALAALTDKPLWAMIETPRGILNAAAIAAHPRIAGFILGTNDLAKDLGTRDRPDRLPLLHALRHSLVAARAYGIVVVDGVYNAFKDDVGLDQECQQGRDMGFDGKTLIHPLQVGIANAAFGPTPAEIDLAERQIAAFEEAEAQGQGVAVLDGKIVENLHVETARATLDKAKAIEELAQ